MTEKTLASIALAFSYAKVALGTTSDGSGSFAPGAEIKGSAVDTPHALWFAAATSGPLI